MPAYALSDIGTAVHAMKPEIANDDVGDGTHTTTSTLNVGTNSTLNVGQPPL